MVDIRRSAVRATISETKHMPARDHGTIKYARCGGLVTAGQRVRSGRSSPAFGTFTVLRFLGELHGLTPAPNDGDHE